MKQNFLLNDLHYIVFSGGAQRGNAFIGSMSVLHDIHSMCKAKVSLHNQIQGYGGVSIGALFALGCSIGIPFKKYRKWCINQDTKDFMEECDISNVYYRKGLLSKELISKYIRDLLLLNKNLLQMISQLRNNRQEIKEYSDDFLNSITFLELFKTSKKWLRIVGSNLSTQKVIIMDYKNTPFLSVVDACTASMSIPLVFQPSSIPTDICLAAEVLSSNDGLQQKLSENKRMLHYQNQNTVKKSNSSSNNSNSGINTDKVNITKSLPAVNCIVDGGIYDNYPITLFPIEETLGFRLRSMNSQTPLNKNEFGIQEYCISLLMNTMEYYEDYILKCLPEIYRNHTITIYLPSCSAIEMICASKELKKNFITHGEFTMFFYLFFDKVLCLVFFIIIFLLMLKD